MSRLPRARLGGRRVIRDSWKDYDAVNGVESQKLQAESLTECGKLSSFHSEAPWKPKNLSFLELLMGTLSSVPNTTFFIT